MRSAIAVALCAVGLSAAAAEPVTYLDWDDANKKMTNAICTAFEVVTADTATFEAGKTYVVQGTVEQSVHGIAVEGTSSNPTRLILCDGTKLTVTGQSAAETAGLNVSNGTAIVICGQKGGTGVLEAAGGAGAAGIGGNAGQAAGTVTIYGGSVTALGKDGAAGIGGGMNKTDTGTVTFGAKFSVVTGETAAVTAPIPQDDYVNDHSAKYAHIEPLVVAQFVKGGEVVAKFATADEAVAALDDAQYADIEEFRIGLAADTVFDFGGRTNRVVILNVGAGTNTLVNVLLDGADGGCAVTGMVGTVVFGDGVRIEKSALDFKQGWVDLIIKGGLYKNEPIGYCEDGYLSARRYDENEHLNGLYAVLPAAEIAVEDRKEHTSTRYATLQDAFNLIGENKEVTLRLFNNLELGTAVTKLEGNKVIHLLPSESGANTITRVGAEPVIEIGRGAKLEISNVIFDGANVTSEIPMIEVAGKTGTNFGWLIAGDGFVVSNAVGGAVHVGKGGRFELDGVAKIFENKTDDKPKNVIIEDKQAIVLVNGGAVTDGNYAQIGVYSDTDKFMIPGGQFGAVDLSYEYATYFSDGDISVAEPKVGFINDRDGTLYHAAGAKIAAAPTEPKKTYKRWVGGFKEPLEEGDYLISRVSSFPSSPTYLPELIWTARQDAPAAQPAPAVLDWTDTTLTLAVSNGCDYALVTSGSAETNWVSMVATDNTYAFARPAGTDYLCLRRYSITPSNIVSAATVYSVRVAAGTKDDPWTVGEGIAAWTNGTEFVVGGAGTVPDLSKLASKVTVDALTIEDATVTGAEKDAFKGFGDPMPVSLTLPDGWQGELPDDGGNWYGATVNLMGIPLSVRNVTFLQRYPWNGKVDVGFTLTGPAGETNVVVTVRDGANKVANFTAAVTIPADGVFETNLVWDAAAAGLAANFKSDDVTVEVAFAGGLPAAPSAPAISAKSAAGTVDLTVGDRVAKDEETLVVDPAWDETDPTSAKVLIDGEDEPRTYTCASNDLWQTASLEPGRYEAVLMTACSSYLAGFWKVGDDWTVFDSSNITADVTFVAGKTYLFFGTNTVSGATLTVQDGAKFFYDEGASAGLKDGTLELPKRYGKEIVEDGLYQIVEKIKGCEDNPWDIGEGVTAYTNGTELVISGAGTVGALSGVDGLKDLLAGLTAINVTSNGVTGAEAQAFADVGTDGGSVSLSLPDGWQGELPDEDGNWYGATGVTLTAYPLAVRNIQTATHWPWDGKIDITCDLTGSGEVDLSVALTTNGVTVYKATTLVGETTIDLVEGTVTNGVKLVWSAQTDIADANFNASDVRVAVTVTRAAEPIAVQLWEGGPYWAKCNVGATKPEECGYYFWWGDTVGYTNKGSAWISVLDSTKIRFYSSQTPANGTYNKDEATLKSGNWIDDKGNLTATHDAAAKYLDSPWRMPTDAEMQGLTDDSKVSFEWTTENGVYGCLVTGVTAGYTGRSIFLPAAGYGFGDEFRASGKSGYYWSSTPKLDTDGSNYYAWSIAFNSDGSSRNNTIRSNGLAVRPVRDTALSAPDGGDGFAAVSEAFAFDLRTEVALAEGEVTVSNVTWSATKWGEVPEGTAADIGWTNLTTGAIGVLESGLCGEGAKDVALPKKNGDYRLTHSTGDLTSFVTFTVSDYPLGSETNPWEVGAGDDPMSVTAYTNDTGTVFFDPVRGTVTKAGLETVTNALGGANFPAKLIAADGSETNDLVMVLGASGTVYDTIADALAANEASYTLFDVNGYLVSYNGGEGALGTMATDKFIPTVPTNLTANAYEIIGYRFDGWTNAVAGVFYTNRQEGVDFAQPGETLALTALWTQVELEPTGYDELTNMLAKVTRPLTITLNADIVIPVGGKIVVPPGKDVTFAGNGKFDVSAERPALFCGYPVGTGLKPDDLGRFVTDKDVKAYFEDGKVVVRGRGETEDFPWLIGTEGHEDEVTAWAGDEMILAKPARGTASVAALQSVTNALDGYVPGLGELKVISADGTPTNVVMLLGSDGVPYDTLADVLAADPMPETVRLFEVKGCVVNYDGNGAAGEMASETFLPGISTNLAANAFTAAGYAFEGWTTNGVGGRIVFEDRAAIADPQPGVIYDLKAVWTPVPTTVGSYDDLKKVLDQAAKIGKPVEIVLDGTITPPAGEAVVLPAVVDVKFSGDGKIGGLVFKEGVDWFADSIAEHSDAFAYVDPSLTNIAGLVIYNGLPEENRPIDLAALTDAMEKAMYQPAATPFNVLVATGDGAAAMPAKWKDTKTGTPYENLEAAINYGATAVTPNFGSEEDPLPPKVIAEEGQGTDGNCYTATVENDVSGVESNAVWATYADGLIDVATSLNTNVTLKVVAQDAADVDPGTAASLSNKLAEVSVGGKGFDTTAFVDLSVYFNGEMQDNCELGQTIVLHIPWPVTAGGDCGVVRIHDGVAQAIPQGEDQAVDGEYFTVDAAAGEIVLHVNKFSDYAIGSTGAGMLDPSALGTVKYPRANASTGLLREKSSATWTAKPYDACVFAGWVWTNGTPAAAFELLSENERKNKTLRLKIAAGEQVRPTDVGAVWARIDEDRLGEVMLTPAALLTESKSYVTASVSGLPSGLKFNRKTLAIEWNGRSMPKDVTDKKVKVSVKNASGYMFKQTFLMTVSGGRITKIVPAAEAVRTGEPVMLWGDAALGKVKGSKVRVAGRKTSIRATPAKGAVFLGWYEDPTFRNAATNLPKGYLTASQSVVVPEGGLHLFARFVELETWAVGTFDGVYYDADTNALGTVTFTVSSKGKVSGKTKVGGKTYSFSAKTLDDVVEDDGAPVFVAHPTMKVGGKARTLTLCIFENASTGLGAAEILYSEEDGSSFAQAVQNGWKLKPSALPAFPTGRASLTLDVTNERGVLTLKFGSKGKVSIRGKLMGDNGRFVSVYGSTCVLPVARQSTATPILLAQVCVYVAPKRGTLPNGLCEVYDVYLAVDADGKFSSVTLAED